MLELDHRLIGDKNDIEAIEFVDSVTMTLYLTNIIWL